MKRGEILPWVQGLAPAESRKGFRSCLCVLCVAFDAGPDRRTNGTAVGCSLSDAAADGSEDADPTSECFSRSEVPSQLAKPTSFRGKTLGLAELKIIRLQNEKNARRRSLAFAAKFYRHAVCSEHTSALTISSPETTAPVPKP